MEKLLFFRAATVELGKYHTGGYSGLGSIGLKQPSRLSVSNIMTADIRITTILRMDKFCDVIGQRHKLSVNKTDYWVSKSYRIKDEYAALRYQCL